MTRTVNRYKSMKPSIMLAWSHMGQCARLPPRLLCSGFVVLRPHLVLLSIHSEFSSCRINCHNTQQDADRGTLGQSIGSLIFIYVHGNLEGDFERVTQRVQRVFALPHQFIVSTSGWNNLTYPERLYYLTILCVFQNTLPL